MSDNIKNEIAKMLGESTENDNENKDEKSNKEYVEEYEKAVRSGYELAVGQALILKDVLEANGLSHMSDEVIKNYFNIFFESSLNPNSRAIPVSIGDK